MKALQEFMDAARAGDTDTLSRSPELVKSRHEQATALHFAAINGQIEAARWLLDHGADLEAHDSEFHATPLSWANEKGQTAMVQFLVERGAGINLVQAVALGRLDRLEELVSNEPDLLEEEREWGNAVHQACFWGRWEVLEWLIEHGADFRLRSSHGFTPLEVAERQSRDARTHTPMVLPERKAEIELNCARIAERLRLALAA
jgi:ankyrin repeat protein